jgi:hypothetical protein
VDSAVISVREAQRPSFLRATPLRPSRRCVKPPSRETVPPFRQFRNSVSSRSVVREAQRSSFLRATPRRPLRRCVKPPSGETVPPFRQFRNSVSSRSLRARSPATVIPPRETAATVATLRETTFGRNRSPIPSIP